MMASYKADYVAINQYSRPGLKLAKVAGIVMHYTATPGASDTNEHDFFDGADGGGGRYASAHIFVDSDSATLIIPLNEVAYHANEKACRIAKLKGRSGSYYGDANCTSIGIEMCVEKDGSISESTFDRSVDIAVELCKKYGLKSGDIYRHYDVTGKNCPAPWVSKPSEFARFKKAVDAGLKGGDVTQVSKPVVPASAKPAKSAKVAGTIKVLASSLNYYDGPRWTKPVGTVKKGEVFTVVDKVAVEGAYQYRLKSGTYISASSKYVKFTAK